MADFPPFAVPTAEVYDGLVDYNIGDRVGETVASDVWGFCGAQGLPIANIAPYSPTTKGPLGPVTIYRKDVASANHWAAAQMIIPLEQPDGAVGARISADGSGYFVTNYHSFEYTIPNPVNVKSLSPADIFGEPARPPDLVTSEGVYYWDELCQVVVNGEAWGASTQLVRRNSDGSVDQLAAVSNSQSLVFLHPNIDATFWVIEAIDTNPVKIRVGLCYHISGMPAALPTKAFGFCELFTYEDSSPGRLTSGAPGARGGVTSDGTFWGFNAGTIVIPDTSAPTTQSNRAAGVYPQGTTITLSEVGTDDSQPVAIYYRWDAASYALYTAPLEMQSGVLWIYGVDAALNAETPHSYAYTEAWSETFQGGVVAGGNPFNLFVVVVDAGTGVSAAGLQVGVRVGDTASGTETPTEQATARVTESGHAVEGLTEIAAATLADSFTGVDVVGVTNPASTFLVVLDTGFSSDAVSYELTGIEVFKLVVDAAVGRDRCISPDWERIMGKYNFKDEGKVRFFAGRRITLTAEES